MKRDVYNKMHQLKLDGLVNWLVANNLSLKDLTTPEGREKLNSHLATLGLCFRTEDALFNAITGADKFTGLAAQLRKNV